MNIQFHFDGVEATEPEQAEMNELLSSLAKYVTVDPASLDAYLIDDAGKEGKDGRDQAVHLIFVGGKEKVVIEEVSDHHMKAFKEAYHRLKRALEEFHDRETEIKR